jgi:hypothetical protein
MTVKETLAALKLLKKHVAYTQVNRCAMQKRAKVVLRNCVTAHFLRGGKMTFFSLQGVKDYIECNLVEQKSVASTCFGFAFPPGRLRHFQLGR